MYVFQAQLLHGFFSYVIFTGAEFHVQFFSVKTVENGSYSIFFNNQKPPYI